ncbi:MAG: hypothetical protein KIH69_011465 [Anaerolineae bacterium]|nr:hypothetical protein [Anaerolineae bacterium]
MVDVEIGVAVAVGIFVGGMGVDVGGTAVAVGGRAVLVGAMSVFVGDMSVGDGVFVSGMLFAIGVVCMTGGVLTEHALKTVAAIIINISVL